jgi:ubiquinone/menaquinone biosynthesis C-methylase UbiE
MGGLSRALAARASRVTAIDLSDEMIRIARQRSDHYSNIEYVVGDVLQMDLAADSYDCIVMIATLHHLPADVVLEQLIRSLAPRGVLIVHDLLASSGFFDKSLNLIRLPAAALLRWFRGGRLLRTREVRRAWAEHGKRERYLTIEEVEALRDRCLPGASVKRHLLWRYTVVWSENALSGR